MKRIIKLAVLIVLAVATVSCGAAKRAALQTVNEANASMDGQKVDIPLDGLQYMTDAEYFRHVSSGISTDKAVAKKIAEQNARQGMANLIRSFIQSVVKNYTDQTRGTSNDGKSPYAHFQDMAVTVADISLSGSEIAGQELYRLSDGSYEYHICLQLSKGALAKQALEVAKKAAEQAEAEAASAADEEHKFNEKAFEEFFVEQIKIAK